MDLKIFTDNVEPEAVNQIYNLAKQEAFKDCKIRIMPDTHAGAGCVIGFTANLGDKVIPNIVGVDIGCGMLCVKLEDKEIDLEKLDEIIRTYIPSGRDVHVERKLKFEMLNELKCFRELKDTKRIMRSIGTLGGGNHFIEVDENKYGSKYLVIHTGSRNLGKQVADYYQNLAVELMSGKDKMYEEQARIIEEYKKTGRKSEINAAIRELHRKFTPVGGDVPKELSYLTGDYREMYLHDMKICQKYAEVNRRVISDIIINKLHLREACRFETIHNYIEHKTNMVRKGAISAKENELVLIPMNMRDGCIFGIGKGNKDWNESAPHGAGRLMSRSKAKERVDMEEYIESMKGIYTTSVKEGTIDEAPMVYKPMDEIVEKIKDTVEIIDILKPIYNFKACE